MHFMADTSWRFRVNEPWNCTELSHFLVCIAFWGLYSAVLGITLLAVEIAPMKHEDFLLPICEVILRLLIAWPHRTWVWKKHNYNGVKLFLCVWLTSHCHCIELELFGNDHLHRHCQVLLIKAKPMFMWVREPSVNICELWSLYS